jgi:hypothetical protein
MADLAKARSCEGIGRQAHIHDVEQVEELGAKLQIQQLDAARTPAACGEARALPAALRNSPRQSAFSLTGCSAQTGWASPASKGRRIVRGKKNAWTAEPSCATIVRLQRVIQDACYRASRISCTGTRESGVQEIRGSARKGTLTAFFGVLRSERLAEPGLTGKLRTALGTLRLHKKRDSATGIV